MARKMKDSGIEWIGMIPEEWDKCRVKNVAELYTGNSIKDEEKAKYEDPIEARPYISSKDIDSTLNTVDYENGRYTKINDISFKVADSGSSLMCIEGGSAGIKKCLLEQSVSFVNKLCCFNPVNIESRYLYYYLCSPEYEKEFKRNISGLIGGVSVSILKNFAMVTPPIEAQQLIADYLDSKVTKIDEAILKTRSTINEYKALKQSIITRAVTKGVRGDRRPMKDSSIEWIGEIPEEWEVAKVKNISIKVTDGAHTSPVEPVGEDKGYDFISTVNLRQRRLDFNNCLRTSTENYNELIRIGCKPELGDVLISKDGTVGKTTIVDFEKDFVVASSLVIIRPNKKMTSQFLEYFLMSEVTQQSLVLLMSGTALKRVSIEKNANLFVLVPTIEEQCEIAEYLHSKCLYIDSIISKKEQLITELESYKKSLIYEYVTGKKEVPGYGN